ncbi:hypothetical protein BGZ95_008829, partial [Linnemannia exigua]
MVFCCYCCTSTNDEPRKKRKDEEMQLLIQFAKEHVRLFPGLLKTFAICNSEFWPTLTPLHPRDIQQKIDEMLP